MDQLPVEIKIYDYWNPQLHALLIFSSPEPKAHRWAYSIGRHPSSVDIFKRHLLWSHEADSYQISHIASIGRGNEYLCFLFQSDKNSGCYGNLYFPLTYNGKSGNWQFLLSHCRYLDFFLQKCFLCSPLRFIWILSKSLNLIGCHGNIKGKFSKKYSKIFSSEGMKLKLCIHVHD